jgi:hypothetical protein
MDTAGTPFFLNAPTFFRKAATPKVWKKALSVEKISCSKSFVCDILIMAWAPGLLFYDDTILP